MNYTVQQRRAVRRRAAWGSIDQCLSSGTNVALGIVVARSVSLREFGAFSAVYLAYTFLALVSRSISAEVLVVRYTTANVYDRDKGSRAALGTAFLAGLAALVVCLIISLVTGGVLRHALLALAISLPGACVQDALRFVLIMEKRPAIAALMDLLWALTLFAGVAVIATVGTVTAVSALLAWGAGAYVCTLAGLAWIRKAPALTLTGWWWRAHQEIAWRFLAESLLMRGSTHLTFLLAAAVTSLGAFAGLRAASLLLGPLNLLFASVSIVAIPEAARLYAHAPSRLLRVCVATSAAMAVVSLVFGTLLLLLPARIGIALLGDSWLAARTVIWPLTLGTVAASTHFGAWIGLRAAALAGRSLSARAALAPARLIGGTGGALVGQAPGAAWGMAAGEAFGGIVHWYQFLHGFPLRRGADRAEGNDLGPTSAALDPAGGMDL